MKKSRMILTVLAAALIVTVSIGTALAYFTTYTMISGKAPVDAGPTTTIEEFYDGSKHVIIHNTSEDGVAVFVRARAYSIYELSYSGACWTKKGEYWEYGSVVEAGEDAGELVIAINGVPKADMENMLQHFNVVVVYEAVPARYDENGEPYADWTQKVIKVTEQEGNGG